MAADTSTYWDACIACFPPPLLLPPLPPLPPPLPLLLLPPPLPPLPPRLLAAGG